MPDPARHSSPEVESAETGGHGGARVLLGLLLLVPAAAALHHAGASSAVVFVTAVAALVPLAGFLGRATEEIAIRSSPALGALLNASLGNAIELMIAAQLLLGDDPDAPRVVRASLVGSLITNLLLLIGASMIAGGLKFKEQRFNAAAAGVQASLLIIAFGGMAIPTIWGLGYGRGAEDPNARIVTDAVSVILALAYACGLLFTFLTHKHLFDTTDELLSSRAPEWSLGRAVAVLVGSVGAVAYLAHLLEAHLAHAGEQLGLSKIFVGVVVIGAITNVAENLAAMTYARKNDIDLPISIGASSAIQVTLFVAPVLVLIGQLSGHTFLLQFSGFELFAMFLPVLIINHLAHDGVCNWLEGAQLIALYAIIATAFYFVK